MGLSDDDVREILRLIDESDLDELRIDTPELQLHVRRGDASRSRDEAAEEVEEGSDVRGESSPAPSAPLESDVGESAAGGTDDGAADGTGLHTVDSPLLGVFYRAPAPSAPPYVAVGAVVEPDTVVCLIEVMKMMNSIVAGVSGTIVEVCAQNAELVEHGRPLFRVELR